MGVWVLLLRQHHFPHTCLPHPWGDSSPGGRISTNSQAPRCLPLAAHCAVPRTAAPAVCLLPARRHFIPGLRPHHWFAVSFAIDFKFYYWLLEHLRTRDFPSPSIRLFPVEGMCFTIFIPWPVTNPSVLHLEISLACSGSSL